MAAHTLEFWGSDPAWSLYDWYWGYSGPLYDPDTGLTLYTCWMTFGAELPVLYPTTTGSGLYTGWPYTLPAPVGDPPMLTAPPAGSSDGLWYTSTDRTGIPGSPAEIYSCRPRLLVAPTNYCEEE